MRTFLIIISIALSVALTFASISLKGTIMNLFEEQIKQFMGDAEIMVTAGENSKSSWVRLQDLDAFKDRIAYQVGTIDSSASYNANKDETYSVQVKGYRLEDLAIMNPVTIVSQTEDAYAGKSLILGEADAKKLGITLGQTIELKFGNVIYKFKVTKLAASKGLFRESQGKNITVVTPPGTLQKMNDIGNRYSMLLIRSFEGVDDTQLIEDLKKVYNRESVEDPIPEEEIEKMLSTIIIPFLLMITLVVVTSMFIIYTSFKVITQEKLPILGTFRSIGATKKITDWILLIESVFYGVIGGLIGSGLGILVLKGIVFVMSMDPSSGKNIQIDLAYSTKEFIIALSMAIVLAIVSSIIPIIQISKIPLRDIVLNNIQPNIKKSPLKLVAGIILSAMPFILSQFRFGESGILIHGLGMVIMVFGVVMLVPYFTVIMATIFEKVFGFLFGNLGTIGAKNVRDNKSIMNNISLLAIGIGGILMINHVSYSVGIEVVNVYNSAHYDIQMYTSGGSRSLEQRIRSVEGVASTMSAGTMYNVAIYTDVEPTSTFSQQQVVGIKPNEYFDYWDMNFTTDKKKALDALAAGGIILTTSIKDKYDLDIGDTINIKYTYPKEKSVSYKVAGFVNTLMNNGKLAFVSESVFKRDTKLQNFDDVYVRTTVGQDPEVVMERLNKKFGKESLYITTLEKSKRENSQANAQIFMLLTGFSAVAMVIGIFGIFNNFLVSMMGRRRQFAMMRSVGLSKSQMIKMLFTEAFSSGLTGGLVGVMTGYVMVISVGLVLVSMDLPIAMHFNTNMFLMAFISGGIISVLANLLPAFKTSKMNIIEAIKYE
jgi:putative ABC transport system permease protein